MSFEQGGQRTQTGTPSNVAVDEALLGIVQTNQQFMRSMQGSFDRRLAQFNSDAKGGKKRAGRKHSQKGNAKGNGDAGKGGAKNGGGKGNATERQISVNGQFNKRLKGRNQ